MADYSLFGDTPGPASGADSEGPLNLSHLVVVTKNDIAAAVSFDRATFLANVQQVNPGVDVLFTSARTGEGSGALLERALAAHDGEPVHRPVLARTAHDHGHGHDHDHGHGRRHVHESTHSG